MNWLFYWAKGQLAEVNCMDLVCHIFVDPKLRFLERLAVSLLIKSFFFFFLFCTGVWITHLTQAFAGLCWIWHGNDSWKDTDCNVLKAGECIAGFSIALCILTRIMCAKALFTHAPAALHYVTVVNMKQNNPKSPDENRNGFHSLYLDGEHQWQGRGASGSQWGTCGPYSECPSINFWK